MADARNYTTRARPAVAVETQVDRLGRRLLDAEDGQAALAGRLAVVEPVVAALPPPATIWAAGRLDSGFGVGGERLWSHVGDGVSVTFPLPGRLAASAYRYRVTVGGVPQTPTVAYSLPTTASTIVFTAPPPAGTAVIIFAPFYGS